MLQSLSMLTGYDGSLRGIQQVQTSQPSQLSTNSDPSRADNIEFDRKNDHELPLLSFSCVVAATDNFSFGISLERMVLNLFSRYVVWPQIVLQHFLITLTKYLGASLR